MPALLGRVSTSSAPCFLPWEFTKGTPKRCQAPWRDSAKAWVPICRSWVQMTWIWLSPWLPWELGWVKVHCQCTRVKVDGTVSFTWATKANVPMAMRKAGRNSQRGLACGETEYSNPSGSSSMRPKTPRAAGNCLTGKIKPARVAFRSFKKGSSQQNPQSEQWQWMLMEGESTC